MQGNNFNFIMAIFSFFENSLFHFLANWPNNTVLISLQRL